MIVKNVLSTESEKTVIVNTECTIIKEPVNHVTNSVMVVTNPLKIAKNVMVLTEVPLQNVTVKTVTIQSKTATTVKNVIVNVPPVKTAKNVTIVPVTEKEKLVLVHLDGMKLPN